MQAVSADNFLPVLPISFAERLTFRHLAFFLGKPPLFIVDDADPSDHPCRPRASQRIGVRVRDRAVVRVGSGVGLCLPEV